MTTHDIGNIGNYYGSLTVREDQGLFFWSIDDCSGHHWEEIPEYLYNALMRYETERNQPNAQDQGAT